MEPKLAVSKLTKLNKSENADLESHMLIDDSGNYKLIEVLSSWGINLYAGVNGGGVIHFAKYLKPFEGLHQTNDRIPRLLNLQKSGAYL
ncbi:hypothetical protein HYX01_02710 [Candidatus Woesearchaeota archaeon]|nr:hypothetical protein [Candidatus Woesearchaeota archaeon]